MNVVNRWFILPDIGLFGDKVFSCFTSINQSSFRFNILDLNFKIAVKLQWFAYNWRRREGENITYLSAHCEISVPSKDILEIPFFKSVIDEMDETDKIKQMKLIEEITEENQDVKQALIERYGKSLGKPLYSREVENNISVVSDRYCGIDEINNNIYYFVKEGDDASQLKISETA
ncbi:hypothetical protein C823_007836 [Eubacterium plexicaudatum ASF492]|nr:hypothetical protein C823_007836 [Eubacterium plexicaudatum ASF492]